MAGKRRSIKFTPEEQEAFLLKNQKCALATLDQARLPACGSDELFLQ